MNDLLHKSPCVLHVLNGEMLAAAAGERCHCRSRGQKGVERAFIRRSSGRKFNWTEFSSLILSGACREKASPHCVADSSP